jgi:hypothetical protein
MNLRWSIVLLVALSGAGCVSLPTLSGEPKPKPTPPAPAAPAKPKRPTALVTPEQVNDANAHDVGHTLLDELDRDSQAEPATKPAADPH